MIDNESPPILRQRIQLEGVLQGVGFRPYVYKLAMEFRLCGFVCNSSNGVSIEIEGPEADLENFVFRLKNECPPHAIIQKIDLICISVKRDSTFLIASSETENSANALILPDLSTCSDCLTEILDPNNRRYLYPFTNCTHCGPRYSIMEQLPYDRENTSMKKFKMCSPCLDEYHNPLDRRFHAQPNACPTCGPQLELWDSQGKHLERGHHALLKASAGLASGKIVALKGLGGFQLIVDARNEASVRLLRERKHRFEKPLAMMFPGIGVVRQYCEISLVEERALISAQSPIVLCPKKKQPFDERGIANSVSFTSPYWGIMLPNTPLHFLLLQIFPHPLVATSANFAEEPMCIENEDALQKLGAVADYFLVHNRPIVRPVDDSVGMVMAGEFSLIRRARGYAPLPIYVGDSNGTGLALGAQMKNTVALKVQDRVYLSQHIGDLQSAESVNVFIGSIQSLRKFYTQTLDFVAVDAHPDYQSTQYANSLSEFKISIQHHHAHIVSCMAENNLQGPLLGLAWDGTGIGTDKVIWGSEFLVSTRTEFERVAHLYPFRLPGGEASIRYPWKSALGLLGALSGNNFEDFSEGRIMNSISKIELGLSQNILSRGFMSPLTTSMGRLFDGVSALLGLCEKSNYEGQAAILLEQVIGESDERGQYSWKALFEKEKIILDWRPMLTEMISDITIRTAKAEIAAKFHNTLIEMALAVAVHFGFPQVVLSGGCFQNKVLTENLIRRLKAEGFAVYWHKLVPTNDGGVALGQAIIAAEKWNKVKGLKKCV